MRQVAQDNYFEKAGVYGEVRFERTGYLDDLCRHLNQDASAVPDSAGLYCAVCFHSLGSCCERFVLEKVFVIN